MDCFAILQLPRSPWLDEAVVRDQFQRLAATVHPDAGHTDPAAFVALNHAWQTLRSPTSRLRHYLELEHPETLAKLPQNTAADLFMDVAAAQQEAAAVASKLSTATSPLTRALLESARSSAKARLNSVLAKITAKVSAVHQQLQSGTLESAPLSACLSELVFLEKWSGQLRERALLL